MLQCINDSMCKLLELKKLELSLEGFSVHLNFSMSTLVSHKAVLK